MSLVLLQEKGREIDQKRGELAKLFTKDANGQYNMSVSTIEEINRRNDELSAKSKEYEELAKLVNIEKSAEQRYEDIKNKGVQILDPSHAGKSGEGIQQFNENSGEYKSLGRKFTEHKGFADAYDRKRTTVEFDKLTLKSINEYEMKTLMSTSAGFAPFSPRLNKVVPYALRRPVVADLIPQENIGAQGAVKYMEETTNTNNAAAVAEGGAKPESALAFTERSATIEKIATWIPVTDEQLADVPQIRAVIDNRLTTMLELAEENELLNGDGSSPNLNGFYTAVTQTQAKGADPIPDAIFKGMTLVRHTGFADPSGMVMHPNDWQRVRLLRTGDGVYIWGSPAEVGENRIWGLPVVVTTAATEGTTLLGDFANYSQIFRREGIRIESTNSHSDYFIYNKQVILIEERLVLIIYRATAFVEVTGLNA